MKLRYQFFSVFFILFFSSQSISQVQTITIGALIEQGREAASDLIVQGQNSANDVLINAGNTILATVNGIAVAYEDQLEKTVDSLDEQRRLMFRDIQVVLSDVDKSLDRIDSIANTAGAVVSASPGGKKLPVITKVIFPILENDAQTIKLFGFNLAQWEFDITSSTLEVETAKKTSTEIELRTMNASNKNDWVQRHSINIVFKAKEGLIIKNDRDIEFVVSGVSVNWQELEASIKYKNSVQRKEFNKKPVRIKKQQARVGHRWSHRVDYVPTPPNRVDINSFKEITWWEHDECRWNETFYTLESIDEVKGVRVLMQGKEEGGFDKDCGATLVYEVKTFKYVKESLSKSTEWKSVNPDILLSYPDKDTTFISVLIRDRNTKKEIAEITPTSKSRYDFLSISLDTAANTVRVGG